MDIIDLITITIGLLTVIFPLILYIRNRKSNVNKALMSLALTAGPMWSIAIWIYNQGFSQQLDILSLNTIYLVSIFTAFFTFWLTNSYPFKVKMKFLEILLVFGIGFFFIYEIFFTNNFIVEIVYKDNARVPELGLTYILWFIWFAALFLWRMYQIRKNMSSLSGIERKQMQYVITGFTIVGLGVVPTNMILPFFGNFEYIWLGPVFISIMINLIAYGISTTRFVNIRNLIIKITFIIKSIIIPMLLGVLSLLIFTRVLNNSSIWIYFLTLLGTILITYFIIKHHYENKRDLQDLFLNETSATLDINKINSTLREILKSRIRCEDVNLVILDKNHQNIYNDKDSKDSPYILFKQFWAYHKDYQKLIILAELEYLRVLSIEENNIWKYKRFITLIEYLRGNKWQIIFPIQLEQGNLALIYIGKQRKNTIYSSSEITSILDLKNSVRVSLERSLLHLATENFNKSLQQKVDFQTKELQQKVKELQEARRKEADMIDIMGHELRTPMSIVKLNTDLLHNFTENIPKRKEDFKKYVSRIKDAVETEIKLINTLLSSAKLEGDKIVLNPEKVNVIDQIKMSLHAQEMRAKQKSLQLNIDIQPNTQPVYADHARVVEILNNLIDNAVKYTQKGSVTVRTTNEDNYVRISVIDTGPGMTEEDISRIGSKFFRTGNYIQSDQSDDFDIVRPGGTGLGLYVTFNLVRKMGGEIHVESELGKGSNFTFTLPKYNGQKSKGIESSKDMFDRLGLKRDSVVKGKIQE